MRFAFFFNIISPHQIPLAKRIAEKIEFGQFCYLYQRGDAERDRMGWTQSKNPSWCIKGNASSDLLQKVDVLFSGEREFSLFSERCRNHQATFYTSERWFKPNPGFLRMLHPRFFKLAHSAWQLLKADTFMYLPTGVYAAQDMARIAYLFSGRISALWKAPTIAFESRPGGIILPLQQAIDEMLLDAGSIAFAKQCGFVRIPESNWGKGTPRGFWQKMRMWGYFVESAETNCTLQIPLAKKHPKKILWVGRLLDGKRVDTLIRAVRLLPKDEYTLDVYGDGPQKGKLIHLAQGANNIHFHEFVPIAKVRTLMQGHDIYALSSNQTEGWGAVLNEALEEKMATLSSFGTGGGATILPPQMLFDTDDVQSLATKLQNDIPRIGIGAWSVYQAASWLLSEFTRFKAKNLSENSK